MKNTNRNKTIDYSLHGVVDVAFYESFDISVINRRIDIMYMITFLLDLICTVVAVIIIILSVECMEYSFKLWRDPSERMKIIKQRILSITAIIMSLGWMYILIGG